MKKLFYLSAMICFSLSVAGQTSGGTLMGKVTDEFTGEAIRFAPVKMKVGVETLGAFTDDNGEYAIKGIAPGTYNVEFGSLSHAVRIIESVKITTGGISYVNATLFLKEMKGVEITYEKWKVGVIEPGIPPTLKKLDAEQISNSANLRDIGSLLASSIPKVYQQREGGGLNISGSREGASLYYIDGVKVIGTPQVPNRGIGEVIVYTGGIPAQYGDTTSGVILINTKSY